jgi:hypothetical protein
VFELLVFLLGIGQVPVPQQHVSLLSMPLQQAWAFLPFFFFLQQDMSALQQSFISQQAAELVLPCGESRVKAAAETVRAAPHARAITSALNFFISMSPGRKIAIRNSKSSRSDSYSTVTASAEQADF